VDLTGGPDPRVLRWFRDDGTVGEGPSAPRPMLMPQQVPSPTDPDAIAKFEAEEAKRAKELRERDDEADKGLIDFLKRRELPAPPAGLGASLGEFLHDLQTRADQL
jgi:hypothetical protein